MSSLKPNLDALQRRDEAITVALQPQIEALKGELAEFEGLPFESLEAAKKIATDVNGIVNRLQMALRCQKAGCGQPGLLVCRSTSKHENGVLQFDHASGKRTSHGWHPVCPKLELIDPAPDQRKKSKLKKSL